MQIHTGTAQTAVQEWMVEAMSDYIKREDAIKAVADMLAFEAEIDFCNTFTSDDFIAEAKDYFKDIPSADVAPVRHGRWIEYGENQDGTHNMRCSKCGTGLKSKGHANSYYTKHKYRYCNNCGAKMDEEVDA